MNNGSIGLLLHRRKVLRRKNHKEREFGFSEGNINLWTRRSSSFLVHPGDSLYLDFVPKRPDNVLSLWNVLN